MNDDSDPIDFDEIARRLTDELQQRNAPNSQPSPPPPPQPPKDNELAPFEISMGNGDIPRVIIRHEPSAQETEIYCYGACVTKWTTRGENHLWMSELNKWQEGGKAIRGGIPLCFPQFGPYGDLVQHGFARIATWQIEDTLMNEDGSLSAVFKLESDGKQEEVQKWPYKFVAEYTVTLSNVGLENKLTVTNCGEQPMPFTFAFHNYFKTSRVADARIFGFEGLRFNNRLDGDRENAPEEDSGAGLMIAEEVDRVYLDAPDELAMFDFASLKVLKIKKTPTLPNATLWNPFGANGCDPGWETFVCIEPAVVTTPPTLQPGETWVGAQLLGIE